MKCIAGIAFAMAATAVSVDGFKQTILSNGGVRVLSNAAAMETVGGPKTKASGVDTLPNVHNGGVNLYPYTQDIKDYIVQAHNNARSTLVPSEAANMRQLSWDESLAIEASELVNTCIFEHDTENYAYGQNLMYGGMTIDRATVDSWMDGWVKQELSPQDMMGTGYLDLDHASAVLWASTYLVGCASKMCPNGYLTACNYYTPGNWQGEQAYLPGKSCSACPSQAPYCDASGKLCTANQGSGPAPAPGPAPGPTPAPTGNPAQQTIPDANSPTDGSPASGSSPKQSIDRWGNFESSPATKTAFPGVLAALCTLFVMGRAM